MRALLATLILPLLIPGCATEDSPTSSSQCLHTSDCQHGLVCLFSACTTACNTDDDCASNARCLATSDGKGCVTTASAACAAGCPAGTSCASDDVCRSDCKAIVLPCIDGQICDEGQHCIGSDPTHDPAAATLMSAGGSAGTSGAAGAGGNNGATGGSSGTNAGPGGASGNGQGGQSDIAGSGGSSTAGNAGTSGSSGSSAPGGSSGAAGSGGSSGSSSTAGSAGSAGSPLGTTTSLSCGISRACEIKSGQVYCWGDDSFGALDTAGSPALVAAPLPIAGIGVALQVSVGTTHQCAVDANHEVWCWGENDHDELGTTSSPSAPLKVASLGVDIDEVVAGYHVTCARHSNGNVSCFGSDQEGALGDGGKTDSATPKGIALGGVAATQLAAADIVCALLEGATVSCWGTGSPTPIDVGVTSAVEVTVGGPETTRVFVRESSGSIVTMLPMGMTGGYTKPAPVLLPQSAASVVAMSAGQNLCLRMSDGSVFCAGFGDSGFDAFDMLLPPGTGPNDISAGYSAGDDGLACAIRSDGKTVCWGDDEGGELGDGAPFLQTTPFHVPVPAAVTSIALGNTSAVFFTASGAYSTGSGQVLASNPTSTPTAAPSLAAYDSMRVSVYEDEVAYAHKRSGGFDELGASNRLLAIDTDYVDLWPGVPWEVGMRPNGEVVFFANVDQAVTNGEFGVKPSATPVAMGDQAHLTTVAGATLLTYPPRQGGTYSHLCYLASGALSCWGSALVGEVGNGMTTDAVDPPVAIVSSLGDTAWIDACVGARHSCAIGNKSGLMCWGIGEHFQNGTNDVVTSPKQVSTSVAITHLACGGDHTCGWDDAGKVVCWGDNITGQLGDGTFTDRGTPVSPIGLPSGVTSMSLVDDATCAIVNHSDAWCWGDGYGGRMGNGQTGVSLAPVLVIGP